MIFLDTHVVVWLYAGLTQKISKKAVGQLENNDLVASQMVRLELQYLAEIGRLDTTPEQVLLSLEKSIGLSLSKNIESKVFDFAMTSLWTRDVFDRLITAEAAFNKSILITKDKQIRHYYPKALW